MKAEEITGLLKKLNSPKDIAEWSKDKTWKDFYQICERGDWLLWLFKKVNPKEIREITLAKGHCAKTIIHLMKYEESRAATYAAIAFGNGEINEDEMLKAHNKVRGASVAHHKALESLHYYAASTAAFATSITSNPGNTVSTAVIASTRVVPTQEEDARILKLTADLCRKYLPIEIWNI